jgi:3-hydroxybutyryl-CoA dehydrogenase
VTIVGAGTMGSSIAFVCASRGFRVRLNDKTQEFVQKGIKTLENMVQASVEKERISKEEGSRIRDAVEGTVDIKFAAMESDLILEAVYEDLEVKKDVFRRLEEVCTRTAVFASNTSSLSIRSIASALVHRDRFLGIHFFNPPQVMKLVEIVVMPETSHETIELAESFVGKLDKQWVLVKDSPGFIVNRLLIPMLNEAAFLVQENIASPKDIDTAMTLGANMPMGPLALSDLIGLDVVKAIMSSLHRDLGEKYKPCPLLLEKVKAQELGRKTHYGYHRY